MSPRRSTRSRCAGPTRTSEKSEEELVAIVKANFDLRPGCIIRDLQLKRPIYIKTSAYGHFGRPQEKDFTWEQAKELKF
jgi:S-adenosylmethionine synthetase